MPFPTHRPRRLRSSESIRRVVRETSLEPADFILPLWWALGATIPIGYISWWLAYRSGWFE